MRSYMASAEEFRCNGREWDSQLIRLLPEHAVRCPFQLAPIPSQNYCQRSIGRGSHVMPVASSDTLGVTISFRDNLMSHGGLPSPCGVSVMAHSSALTMPYSVPPTVPATMGSLKHGILLVPGMASAGTRAVALFMDQMSHPLNPCNPEMRPARFQQLLSLDSQDSLVTESNVQEEPFVREQPTPAPQGAESPSTSRGSTRRQPPVSRPYVCTFNNCGKAYTKRSHLMSHQGKQVRSPTHVTGMAVHGSSSALRSLDDTKGSIPDSDHTSATSAVERSCDLTISGSTKELICPSKTSCNPKPTTDRLLLLVRSFGSFL